MKIIAVGLTIAWALLWGVVPSATGGGGHGHGHGHSNHHGGHGEQHEEERIISPQALANMGVVIEEIDASAFTRYTSVPAKVMTRPRNHQPAFAPFAGRVVDVSAVLGSRVEAGAPLVRIVRDPIPRPNLSLTSEMISPSSEAFHEAVGELHITLKSIDVLKAELTRLETFKGQADEPSVVPQKGLINLKYELAKQMQARSNAHTKLRFHGLTNDEISAIEGGAEATRGKTFWLNALRRNRAWGEHAEALHRLIVDPALKEDLWAGATIAELDLTGLISEELIAWLKATPAAMGHLLEIATLLQEGHSLLDVRELYRLGALSPMIVVRAPANDAGWDIHKLLVKPGERVVAGAPLLMLADESKMYLVAEPAGSELLALNTAAKQQYTIAATPLTPGVAPIMADLVITKFDNAAAGRTMVYLPVANQALGSTVREGVQYRNWALRDGMPYTLKVPVKRLADVIVLPSEAVVQHGPDKVVFVQEGDEFIRRKVVVAYQDHEVAVIAEGSELLPDEAMVVRGAFALHLALIAGTPEAVDPHAGHSH